MLAAHILRSGDVKVKIVMEMTLDELKKLREDLKEGTGRTYGNDPAGRLMARISHVSNEIEQIFNGALEDE